jgi:Raf kinase inhibitor-like YbhB/YbcL family protein
MNKNLLICFLLIPFLSKAATTDSTTLPVFTAYSNAFENNGSYPKLYTCDSLAISPPIAWKNIPKGTQSFAITMHHFPKDGGKHVYMVVYNIPATVTNIPQAATNIGVWGSNTQNKNLSYSPPCSKGPGPKNYIITVYALSNQPSFTNTGAVSMDDLLLAIKNSTLASSTITVHYAR